MTISETGRLPLHLRPVRPPESIRWELDAYSELIVVRGVDLPSERRRLACEVELASLDEDYRATDVDELFGNWKGYVEAVGVSRTKGGGRRGVITSWSAGSRNRLVQAMAAAKLDGRVVMVTLTYGGEWRDAPSGELRGPRVVKDELKAWRKRMEREFGELSGMWKMETQRRGAPHFHVGIAVDQSIDIGVFYRFAREAWHAIVEHAGVECVEACDHAVYGVHLDASFADRIRDGRASLACYLAKHGTWTSKEYQHQTPGVGIRRLLEETVRADETAGECDPWCDEPPVLADLLDDDGGVVEVLAAEWERDRWLKCADLWDTPGRWWGLWRIERPVHLDVDNLDQLVIDRLRLLARKIYARRTLRGVLVGRDDGSTTVVPVRRTLRSLHDTADRGFWMVGRDGEGLARWMLDQACRLAWFTGVELARELAKTELPPTEFGRRQTAELRLARAS